MYRRMKFWHQGPCYLAHHLSCLGKKETMKSFTIAAAQIARKIRRTRMTMIMF